MLSNHPNVLGGNGPSASSDLIGDVDGPASATDNAVARFDGTTGKLIQNSVVTISDTTGDIAGAQSLTSPASNNLTLAGGSSGASLVLEQGANANINLTPSGTGSIISSISGTAFYPSFAVGANTGLFFASASSLGFSTAGTERARFVGSTGDFLLSSTTAGSSGAGALVVQGGLATGAASYFGGAVAITKADADAALAITASTGTNPATQTITNTGGTLRFGLDNSSQSYANNGLYATFISRPAATNFVVLRGSTTDLLISSTGAATFAGTISPQQATTAAAPAYVKGAIYFDTTLNKLRVGGATAYETITSV